MRMQGDFSIIWDTVGVSTIPTHDYAAASKYNVPISPLMLEVCRRDYIVSKKNTNITNVQ